MGKYFYLQWKRISRLLPAALCVAALLFGALAGVFAAFKQINNGSEKYLPVRIGIVGDTEHSFFQIGLQALGSFDSSNFSLELTPVEASEADTALKTGQLSAYVVIPKEFMDNALEGNFMQLDFISTAGATGIASMVKEDFSRSISDILAPAQRGTYGVGNALRDLGLESETMVLEEKMVLRYVEQAVLRSNAYRVEQVGIGNGLNFENYLLCGLSVMLVALLGLSFAPVMICHDHALSRLLQAKGNSAAAQTAVEFTAYFAVMLLLMAVIYAVLAAFSSIIGFSLPGDLGFFAFVPVLLMVAALSYLLYALAGDLITGVLLQFFAVVAMGFVSGCIYPVFFFPEAMQQAAAWLPTGLARAHLAAYITGDSPVTTGLLLVLCSAVFFFAAVFLRKAKLRHFGR